MSEKEKDVVKTSDKSSKPGLFQRIGKFFKEYRGELKKISWPTFAEVVKNTMITLAAVLLIGAVIWVFDFAITSLRDAVIANDGVSASDVVEEVVPEDVVDEIVSIADVSASDLVSTADAE